MVCGGAVGRAGSYTKRVSCVVPPSSCLSRSSRCVSCERLTPFVVSLAPGGVGSRTAKGPHLRWQLAPPPPLPHSLPHHPQAQHAASGAHGGAAGTAHAGGGEASAHHGTPGRAIGRHAGQEPELENQSGRGEGAVGVQFVAVLQLLMEHTRVESGVLHKRLFAAAQKLLYKKRLRKQSSSWKHCWRKVQERERITPEHASWSFVAGDYCPSSTNTLPNA